MEQKKSKHNFNVPATIIFSLVLFFGFINKANAQTRKPNIIFILGDDVGYKSLNCDGGNLYSTSYIDTIAQQGMRFTQCQATPMCSPSRHMLLTGKYNFRNYYKWGYMDSGEKTVGNMMRDAGYKTAIFGKEQLGGDGGAINSWGFDDYCVYHITVGSPAGSKYKNPHIYTHGAFLPDSKTLNKYGPDVISDSVLSFIETNKLKPFFIYYPLMLVHTPFAPTPDDPEFASWNPSHPSDTSFFRSMMHYMDKKVGDVIEKLKSLGIDKNTIIFFSGDNGTPGDVGDYGDDDNIILGGKKSTTEAGTHVPLIAYWPGTITPGAVNNDLVDFSDFLPTFAGIANISVPDYYDEIDGVNFAPRLIGKPGTPRDWIFCDFNFKPGSSKLYRWAQTDTYKLYDTSSGEPQRFYNISKDSNERHPIPDASLTPPEIKIRQKLLNVINNHVAQGKPLISLGPSLALLSDSSVVLEDTIRTNGGSTVTASGAVWSTSPNPKIPSSDHTSTGVIWGPFSTAITGLIPNITYFLKTYATNYAGTAYSNQVKFKTLGPPVATAATALTNKKFTANWEVYPDATSYRLDVSTSPTFSRINTPTINQGFDNGISPPGGWTISSNVVANASVFGSASPSLEFRASNAQVITKKLNDPASTLSFWIKGLNINPASSLLVEGYNGNTWKVITTITNLPATGTKKTFNATSNPPLSQNFIQFRFTYTKNAGTFAFDDVSIKYDNAVPFFDSGYNNLFVKGNSRTVNGLTFGTKYYYRVRAVSQGIASGNSNIIGVTTNIFGFTSSDSSNLKSAKENDAFKVVVSPNPTSDAFSINVQSTNSNNIQIIITDINGKKMYETRSNNFNNYVIGKQFSPGVYFIKVIQGQNIKTLKLVKEK